MTSALFTESVHHANRAEPFLCLRKDGAFLFLNRSRFASDAVREKVNCADDEWNDAQREQSQLPIQLHHDRERPDQCDDRSENAGEALVVDCLDRLRIVSDTKTRVARAADVVILQRERLEIGVKISAQFQQRLKPDLHEKVIGDPVDESPQKLDDHQRETEQRNPSVPIAAWCRIWSQKIIHDYFERPRFEQIQSDANEREQQADHGLRQKWSVIAKDTPIDRHDNLRLQIAGFRLNYTRSNFRSG